MNHQKRLLVLFFRILLGGSAPFSGFALAEDCNLNGVDDETDLLPSFTLKGRTHLDLSSDRSHFVAAGDLDGDGDEDLAVIARCDLCRPAVYLLMNRGNGSFNDPSKISIGSEGDDGVGQIVLGDFDGDKDLDIAVVTGSSSADDSYRALTILRNDGGGSFNIGGTFNTGGHGSFSLIAEDLDLDGDGGEEGDLDIAVANSSSGNVSVLLNDGSGNFEMTGLFPTGQEPTSLIAGDLDGDGDADLAVANGIDGTVTVLRNAGDGTFAPVLSIPVGSMPSHLAAADLDRDGHLDLAVAVLGSGIVILRNKGNIGDAIWLGLTIEVEKGKEPARAMGPVWVIGADLDVDGDLDLASASIEFGIVQVFLNRGDGSFSRSLSFEMGDSPRSFVAVNLKGGEGLDLAAAAQASPDGPPGASSRGLSLLFHHLEPASLDVDSNRIPDECQLDCDLNGEPDDFQAKDCNGNTLADRCDLIDFLSFEPVQNGYELGNVPVSLAVFNLDGDARPDLAVANRDSDEVMVLKGKGDGLLDATLSLRIGSHPVWVVAGDLDRDGDDDVVVAYRGDAGQGNRVAILKNESGSLVEIHSIRVSTTGCGEPPAACPTDQIPVSVAIADLDGDKDRDLAVVFHSIDRQSGRSPVGSRLFVFFNNGDGSSWERSELSSDGPIAATVVAADLDEDQDVDLAVSITGGTGIRMHFNDGGGQFQGPVEQEAGADTSWITAGDLDGDGDQDLAAASSSAGSIFLLLNEGGGNFSKLTDLPAGLRPSAVVAADLDGDGDLDLASSDFAVERSSSLWLFLNRGNNEFARGERKVQAGPYRLATADLDGDGLAEIVTLNTYSDSLSVLRNQSKKAVSQDHDLNGIPDECLAAFRRGDANVDGSVNLTDAIHLLGYLFLGGQAPRCQEAGNVNDDPAIDLSDPVSLLSFLFLGGLPPPAPGSASCGLDPGGAGQTLGCLSYERC